MEYTNVKMVGDDQNVRFLLKKEGKKMLIVVGVNPNTATDKKSDSTMRKVMGYATRNGFDGFLMLNLSPQHCASPHLLDAELNSNLHQENLKLIAKEIASYESPTVLLAFGDTIGSRSYLKDCLKDIVAIIEPHNPSWVQIGQPTQCGNPRHPSRPAYCLFTPFDITKYSV